MPLTVKQINETLLANIYSNKFMVEGFDVNNERMMNLNFPHLIHLMASILLVCGFLAQLSSKPESGLPLITVAFAIIAITNLSDLVAFLTGIDYLSPSPKMEFDSCLQSAVPIVNSFGLLLSLIAMLSMSNDKMSRVWFGLFGSSLIYMGGLLNVSKILKM